MPVLDGVEAEIIIDDVVAKEYPDPDVEDAARSCTRYIEALPDQKFHIRVTWPQGHQMYTATDLAATVDFDHVRSGRRTYNDVSTHLSSGRRLIGDQRVTIRDLLTENSETGCFQRSKFCFGRLQLCEDDALKNKIGVAESTKIGSIQVRAWLMKGQPRRGRPGTADKAKPTDNLFHEKVDKGRNLNTIVGFYDAQTVDRPSHARRQTRIPGDAGEDLTFTFLYRSRAQLQNLGCIPQTPTPQPTMEELLETNRRLQEEVEALTHEAEKRKIKEELELKNASARKRRRSASLDREGIRERNDVAEILQTATPVKRRFVVMDLTQDDD